MKKIRRLVLDLFFVLCWSSLHAQTIQVLVPASAEKWVLVPKSDIGLTWRSKLSYDQTGWRRCSGSPGGVGYETGSGYEQWISLDTRQDMHQSGTSPNTSCYIRLKFSLTAEKISSLGALNLNVWYDDGFVAFLNGEKVAEANAPASLTWNAAAAGDHEAAGPETFDISNYKNLLRVGENLLAVHALNNSITSSDFLFNVEIAIAGNPISNFTVSNLPLVYIDTGGKWIPDEPKIPARMGIIYHGVGSLHKLNEPFNDYNGLIGIETRGSSSQSWSKKQYAVETWSAVNIDTAVSLMGLPKETDWILNAPFIDRSLMRDVLAYDLYRRMGRYASRTRFCELFLNGQYKGVYILMEKIKRDRWRVNISKADSTAVSGDALTGGYIFKIDKEDGAQRDGFFSKYRPVNGANRRVYYQYHYPSSEKITPAQKAYLRSYVNTFEDMMYSSNYNDPKTGYPKWINVDSFVDFFIISEVSKNVDCYRLSTFMYKDRDSKDPLLYMGPIWDYNLAFGLADYYDGEDTDGWMLEELLRNTGEDFPVPFWWQKLFQDPKFNHRIKQRWYELRSSVYDVARIHAYIDAVADTLNEAQARNFAIWPGPGKPGEGFWPMPKIFYTFRTYRDETNYLKYWIERRIRWMDENVLKLSETLGRSETVLPQDFALLPAFPNPFNPSVNIVYELKRPANVFLGIYNTRGECLRVLQQGEQSGGRHQVQWDGLTEAGSPAASGVYYARMFVDQSRELSQSIKLLLLR